MAIYYIENENGSFKSADGTKCFMRLSGKQAYEYLKSPEGQKKRFMRTSSHEDGGEEEFVEIPSSLMRQHRKDERHEQYVSDCMENSGLITISLYAMEDDEDSDLSSGEELIADPSSDVEDQVVHEISIEILRRALKALTDEELWLLHRLYLSDEPVKELQLSRETGIPQKTLNDRKMRALKRLKMFFEK